MPAGAPFSETPAAPGVDAANSLFFADDFGLKGVYAIHLDQQTGDLNVAWSRPDWWSSDYFSMVGPANQRVLISQDINPATTTADIATGLNYTESVLWVNEATGKTIAQSKENPSTALGSLANIGYGGRIYMMGNAGTLFIYQVEPMIPPLRAVLLRRHRAAVPCRHQRLSRPTRRQGRLRVQARSGIASSLGS